MKNPKVLDDFLAGEPALKTSVTIDQDSVNHIMVAALLVIVMAFLAYKVIVKK